MNMETYEIREKYNYKVKNNFESNYEFHRWFKTNIKKCGYKTTKDAILRQVSGLKFDSYFELGPGAGTWTRLFIEKNPKAKFELLDISSEMLSIARKSLPKNIDIEYIEDDFLKFEPKNEYDLFVSVRAVEYFPKKSDVIKKVFSLVKKGGTGIIVTKTPKYLRARLLNRKIDAMHKGMISPRELIKLLIDFGFSDIKVYPSTMSFPFLNSCGLNFFLYKVFKFFRLNFISGFFSESYIVSFKKI